MLNTRIRKARIAKGLSQTELAKKLRINRSAVANWECGASKPRSAHLQQFALLTDVSFEWLATGRGSPSLREEWIPAAAAEIVDDPHEIQLLQAYRTCATADRRSLIRSLARRSPEARQILAGHPLLASGAESA